ncbi:hypothetical protein [Mycobacterium sp. pR1184]|uniref:hypothetical protein n=1 Tax=Mycobacterium sp. pR1184 TaxID=3238981 RepID=UPI00351BBDBD
MAANPDTVGRDLRDRAYRSLAIVAIGLAHFVFPSIFDRINRVGFPERTRRFTFLNGAIETTIGVLTAIPGDRRPLAAVSAGYLIYLSYNVIRTQTGMRKR